MATPQTRRGALAVAKPTPAKPARANPLDALKDRAAGLGRPLSAGEGMALLLDDAAGQSDLQGHAMAAVARAPAKPARKATDADAMTLLIFAAAVDPNAEKRQSALNVILRACAATMAQSKAEAAYGRWLRGGRDPSGEARAARLDIAQDETDLAGAALAKAIRGMSGAK